MFKVEGWRGGGETGRQGSRKAYVARWRRTGKTPQSRCVERGGERRVEMECELKGPRTNFA